MKFYAQPYDLDATGFYFDTLEEYEAKSEANRNAHGQPVEEYEIQFIDGTEAEAQLATAFGINQMTFGAFIEFMDEGHSERALAGAFYRLDDLGESSSDVIELSESDLEEGILFETTDTLIEEKAIEEYVDEFIEDTGMLNDMPENLRMYFDTEAFARDMRLGGDVSAFTFCGTVYVWDNHHA